MKTVERKIMISAKIHNDEPQNTLGHTTQRLLKVSIIFQNLNVIQALFISFLVKYFILGPKR